MDPLTRSMEEETHSVAASLKSNGSAGSLASVSSAVSADTTDTSDSASLTSAESSRSLTAKTQFSTLREAITHFQRTAKFLQERIDTIEWQLQEETFQAANVPLKIREKQRETARRFLETIDCEETDLTLGMFLKCLNRYLIANNCVDLNDLQIYTSPFLRSTLGLLPTMQKVPYPWLLAGLPVLFE